MTTRVYTETQKNAALELLASLNAQYRDAAPEDKKALSDMLEGTLTTLRALGIAKHLTSYVAFADAESFAAAV